MTIWFKFVSFLFPIKLGNDSLLPFLMLVEIIVIWLNVIYVLLTWVLSHVTGYYRNKQKWSICRIWLKEIHNREQLFCCFCCRCCCFICVCFLIMPSELIDSDNLLKQLTYIYTYIYIYFYHDICASTSVKKTKSLKTMYEQSIKRYYQLKISIIEHIIEDKSQTIPIDLWRQSWHKLLITRNSSTHRTCLLCILVNGRNIFIM